MTSIWSEFKKSYSKSPDKTALIFEGQRYSYKDLKELSDKLTSYLLKKVDNLDQPLGVFLDNSPFFAALLLTASRLNLTIVPFPVFLKGLTLENLLKELEIKTVLGEDFLEKNFESLGVKFLPIREFLNFPPTEVEFKPDLEKPYIITTTSGSTGKPKPIVLTQKVKLLRAFEGAKKVFNLTADDIYIVSTPLYHSLAERFVLLPLMDGATAVLLKKFTLKKWLEAVQNFNVTFAVLVSSQLEAIVSHLTSKGEDLNLSSLRKLISSSAPLLENTRKKALKLAQKYGWEIFETYGTSEVGFATILNMTKETDKWNSVGKPLPYVDIKIFSDKGEPLPPNRTGEIGVKTKTIFAGYYKMEETTKRSFINGYFLTGDLGYLDSEGYLYFKGRKKEVIITGGINVYPQDVERVILKHPKVKECAVFGVPHDYLGEIVCAFIVPKEGENLSLSKLRNFLVENLAPYQVPLYMELREEIPKNNLGKVVRRDLKRFVDMKQLKNRLRLLKFMN